MNFALYQHWDEIYRSVLCSTTDYADSNSATSQSEKMKEIHLVFTKIDDVFEQIRQGNIKISASHVEQITRQIDGLKQTVLDVSNTKYVDYDSLVYVCDDEPSMDRVLNHAKSLLLDLYALWLPIFSQEVMGYRKEFQAEIEQIKEAKKEAVIKSLSENFGQIANANKGQHTKIVQYIILAIVLVMLALQVSAFCYTPARYDTQYLIYFYFTKLSFLALCILVLGFLFKVRKDLFDLWAIYQHKFALTSSFISFQEQIDRLPSHLTSEKQQLNIQLLETAIKELGENPILILRQLKESGQESDLVEKIIDRLPIKDKGSNP